MSARRTEPRERGEHAERLVALARALLARSPDDPGWVVADVAAIRREVEAVARGAAARAGAEADAARRALREALERAGLAPVAPEGASLAAIQAGLARLHGLVATLVLARSRRRVPGSRAA